MIWICVLPSAGHTRPRRKIEPPMQSQASCDGVMQAPVDCNDMQCSGIGGIDCSVHGAVENIRRTRVNTQVAKRPAISIVIPIHRIGRGNIAGKIPPEGGKVDPVGSKYPECICHGYGTGYVRGPSIIEFSDSELSPRILLCNNPLGLFDECCALR